MAINIQVLESIKELVSGIPEYITVIVDTPCNVYFTFDGSAPDQTGMSLSTHLLETIPSNPLEGYIFIPTNKSIVDLNILAVGVDLTNTGSFFRRYENRISVTGGLPGIRISFVGTVGGGEGYSYDPSHNITQDGYLIWADGYYDGYSVYKLVNQDAYGFMDAYGVAVSGGPVLIPADDDDRPEGYSGVSINDINDETELSYNQIFNQTRHTPSTYILENDGGANFTREDISWDPRSPSIRNAPLPGETGSDTGTGAPVQYFDPINNWDDQQHENDVVIFNGKTAFDPHASYILLDGRIDGYMNGYKIEPSDVKIINKPYGSLRYNESKEDLAQAYRTPQTYISGGFVGSMINYNKNEIQFYYFDHHDNRWITSIQKFEPPKFEIVARRNGQVVGWVFKWLWGRRTMYG